MIDGPTLDRAVSAGIINAAQRDALLTMANKQSSNAALQKDAVALSVDDQMRLVGGGNDIFVTVGIVLLFSGALFALRALLPSDSMILAALLGAASWGVAEIVTRQKRMRLSSTLLALVFSASVFAVLSDFISARFGISGGINLLSLPALREDAVAIGLMLGGGVIR